MSAVETEVGIDTDALERGEYRDKLAKALAVVSESAYEVARCEVALTTTYRAWEVARNERGAARDRLDNAQNTLAEVAAAPPRTWSAS